MSLEIPASVERDIESYARAERISPSEAAVQLIQSALRATRRESPPQGEISEAEWQTLRGYPVFAFLESLPDDAAEGIEKASEQARAERLSPRG